MHKTMPLFKPIIVLLIPFTIVFNAHTMHDNPHVLIIPGIKSWENNQEYIAKIIGVPTNNTTQLTSCYFPFADLGQENCIKPIKSQLQSTQYTNNCLIYAISQGTATLLNYLGNPKNTNKTNRIKCLILEAVLASSNSAIEHTISNKLKLKCLMRLPFAYYWMPYLSKVPYPFYSPAGIQPIKSIEHIPLDIPIILIHAQRDPVLSYNDACALYYRLKLIGHNKIYFINTLDKQHAKLLESYQDKQKIIRQILNTHNIIKSDEDFTADLSPYQPDQEQFKNAYENLMHKEKNHEFIASPRFFYPLLGTLATTTIALSWIMWKYNQLV